MTSSKTETLLATALDARNKAHAPYSKFHVGAAILDETGAIHAGCNIENASYPEGWCAETSAIAHMIMAGGRTIKEVCVVGPGPQLTTPCGGCRQRLSEFATADVIVHVGDPEGIKRTFTMADLLPAAFDLDT